LADSQLRRSPDVKLAAGPAGFGADHQPIERFAIKVAQAAISQPGGYNLARHRVRQAGEILPAQHITASF
jgi:hypothetical protein